MPLPSDVSEPSPRMATTTRNLKSLPVLGPAPDSPSMMPKPSKVFARVIMACVGSSGARRVSLPPAVAIRRPFSETTSTSCSCSRSAIFASCDVSVASDISVNSEATRRERARRSASEASSAPRPSFTPDSSAASTSTLNQDSMERDTN